jgi:hypothetical protein
LSWRDKGGNGAVGIFIIGRLGKANLDCAQSDYNDPSYREELVLEPETMSALKSLLESGPLTDDDDIH